MHMKAVAMPKLVLMLLKVRTGSAMSTRLNGFFQHVLDLTVLLLRETNSWEMIESATRILTDGPNLDFYNQSSARAPPSTACDVDSHSSAEGSCSDVSDDEARGTGDSILKAGPAQEAVSPLYIQNIEHFHQLGGFDILLERIVR